MIKQPRLSRLICDDLSTMPRASIASRRRDGTALPKAFPQVLEKFQQLGFGEMELRATLDWIQDGARAGIREQCSGALSLGLARREVSGNPASTHPP